MLARSCNKQLKQLWGKLQHTDINQMDKALVNLMFGARENLVHDYD